MKSREYKKRRVTVRVGETVEIPGHAEAVSLASFSPGDVAQVSWLEPFGVLDKGVMNKATVQAIKTHYADTSPVEIPVSAWAVSVYEPLESVETTVYYLQ